MKDLSSPVVVQAIQCCANSFDFVVFQLNSLNLDDDEGVKNFVWVESGKKFFKFFDHWDEMREVAEFDPKIFRKFLTLILQNSKISPPETELKAKN